MTQKIEEGFTAILAESGVHAGAITLVERTRVVVYVENCGAFNVPMSAVRDVHDDTVVLARRDLSRVFLLAVQHAVAEHTSADGTKAASIRT